jgi:tetratricopeptide (TPR) repeat protein
MGHWSANLGLAYLMLGRDEDALPHYMRAVAMEPSSASRVLYLAAGYALLGRTDEARSVLQGLREQRPDITIRYLRPTDMRFSPNPLWRWTRDRQLAGLRLAGLPED